MRQFYSLILLAIVQILEIRHLILLEFIYVLCITSLVPQRPDRHTKNHKVARKVQNTHLTPYNLSRHGIFNL